MPGSTAQVPEPANVAASQLEWAASIKAERVVMGTLAIGASCAFAALLRVAIQNITGPAANLAHLAVAASILHGILLVLMHFTHPRLVYIRFVHAHVSGALLAGSMFGGLASIWH